MMPLSYAITNRRKKGKLVAVCRCPGENPVIVCILGGWTDWTLSLNIAHAPNRARDRVLDAEESVIGKARVTEELDSSQQGKMPTTPSPSSNSAEATNIEETNLLSDSDDPNKR